MVFACPEPTKPDFNNCSCNDNFAILATPRNGTLHSTAPSAEVKKLMPQPVRYILATSHIKVMVYLHRNREFFLFWGIDG
jgi:hypothetical protein